MKKRFLCLLCLLVMIPAAHPAAAFSPTPTPVPCISPSPTPTPMRTPECSWPTPTPTTTPTPTPSPTPLPESPYCMASVIARIGEKAIYLRPVMRYASNGLICADGIIFMSGLEYAEHPFFGEIPTEVMTGQLTVSVEAEPTATESHAISLFQVTAMENGAHAYLPMTWDEYTPEELDPGTYLLMVSISTNREPSYYSGECFLWLKVPERN